MKTVNLQEALQVLREGQILIYPTETFYGLGVDIHLPKALDRLFQLKGREEAKAISVLVGSLQEAETLVAHWDPVAQGLAKKFWPGPLTLVLPASAKVPRALTGGSPWVGLRVSSHPLAQGLQKAFAGPLTTTSANPSGQPAATRTEQLKKYFQGEEIFLLEGGDLPDSRGSTVVKIEKNELKPLREGEIPITQLKLS